jgi:autotransporter-associated beta strand protein
VGDGGENGAIDSTSGIEVNGTLIFNRSDEVNVTAAISGTGTVDQQGGGSLTLSAANTYTGITNIRSGELIVTHAESLGDIAGGTIVDGGSLVVSGGIALANEAITLNGTGTNGAGALASRAGSNTVTGEVTLSGNASINAGSDSGLTITGAINGNKELTAFGDGNFSFAKIGNATAVAGINITGATSVEFTDAVTSTDNISVIATNNINLNGTMTATGSMVRFDTTGTVTQTNTGNIVADRLALKGVGGIHTLTAITNDVRTIAADTGSLEYVNAGNLTIGAVNPTGVNATGVVSITTVNGDLVVSQNITTINNSNADVSLIAQNGSINVDANINVSGNLSITTFRAPDLPADIVVNKNIKAKSTCLLLVLFNENHQ